MRIPDYEMRSLFDWSTAELERIEKEYPPSPGLDGPENIAQKKHFAEYNKRLAGLKEKYGAEPVAKARTFSEMLQPKGA